jgi:VIT1/CCC1 family predicted Fe2+/Mn2+ transporter
MSRLRVVSPTTFGLAPGDTLGEILFGLIMVLTFTLGAGIAAGDDPGEARELILGAMTCNIAWGLIDGVFYVMGLRYDRSRRERLLDRLSSTSDKDIAMDMIRDELKDQLAVIADPRDRIQLYDRIYEALRKGSHISVAIGRRDIIEAIGVFLLVALTALPAAVPFLFFSDPWQALRLSNAILLGLLFLVGYRWAGLTHANPWLTGFGLTLLGAMLVVVAIALGG